MKRSAVLLVVAALALAACGREEGKPSDPRVELQFQDDRVLFVDPDELREVVRTMRELGADRIRITAGWGTIAPNARSRRRPDFDATDPDAYPQGAWDRLDRAVDEVIRQGMKVMLDVAFWAPRWAVERGIGAPDYRWLPDPDEFGQFAEAVARRYDGKVRLWTTWNEPNHSAFLLPQEVAGVNVAAHRYRAMHERGYEAIKGVSEDNEVLVGGLASIGAPRATPRRTSSPLRFLRQLACVDEQLRPLRLPQCRDFRPLEGDGFAYHPYTRKSPPLAALPDPDDAGVGDLDKLTRLLEALRRRGRIASRLPIYITEFGYETNPPDPKRGLPLSAQGVYLSQAATTLVSRPDVRQHAQFLLRDLPPDVLYQTGLLLPDGRRKPAFATFKIPFWIYGNEAVGWVYPAQGPVTVALERRVNGGWERAAEVFRTDADGVARRRVPREGVYRLRWEDEVSLPASTRAAGG